MKIAGCSATRAPPRARSATRAGRRSTRSTTSSTATSTTCCPSRSWRSVKEFDGTQCKDVRLAENSVGGGIQRVQARRVHRAGWHDVHEVGGVELEAARGWNNEDVYPVNSWSSSTCPTGEQLCGPVVMSESSTATSVSDRSLDPNLVASRAPRTRSARGFSCRRLLRLEAHRRRLRRQTWAADASRILSETSEPRAANPSATSACRRTVRAFRRRAPRPN